MSRKINQLIKLEDLANTYAQIIGNYMDIKLNVATDVDPYRSQAIMFATRQPYKISNIKAEQLQIALRFYVCCETETEYNEAIKILTQLLGLNKGKFTSNEKEFKYFSFLDLQRPLGDPEVNSGKFFQTLEIVGQCLVTQCNGGALIGNETSTEIYFNVDGNKLGGEIQVISGNTTLTRVPESPQMADAIVGQTVNTTQLYGYNLNILILKDAVCERIVKALENIDPLELNETIELVITYPPFAGDKIKKTHRVVLTNGTIDRSAGAFITAQLTFQDKLDIDYTIIEENVVNTKAKVVINPNYAGSIVFMGANADYVENEDGSITCPIGSTIYVAYYVQSHYSLNVTGGTATCTNKQPGSTLWISPLLYDIVLTSNEVNLTLKSNIVPL